MYWIYENWRAVKGKKAVIHKASCGCCKNGQGTDRNKLGEANGKWHGPFRSYYKAQEFSDKLPVGLHLNCGSCHPKIP